MDDMDADDVAVHVTDEPMDIDDDELDGQSKPAAGVKKLGKRRKKKTAAATNTSVSEDTVHTTISDATAERAGDATTTSSEKEKLLGVSTDTAGETDTDEVSHSVSSDTPEPEESFTAVDATDLEGTKVRRLGRKKRASSSTFPLPTSEVSQGLLYETLQTGDVTTRPKEASEYKYFGQD